MRYWLTAILVALVGSWSAAASAGQLEKLLMPGEVSKAHAKIEVECNKCHDRTDSSRQTTLCIDCHKDIGTDLQRKRGFHGHALKPGAACTARPATSRSTAAARVACCPASGRSSMPPRSGSR